MSPKWQRVLVLGLILLGVVIVGFFGVRTLHAFREFRGHRPPPFSSDASQPVQTDVELIREWMTVPFVAHMYAVPERDLFDALKVPPKENHDKSLEEINNEFFPQADGLAMQIVKDAILAHQAASPPSLQSPPSP